MPSEVVDPATEPSAFTRLTCALGTIAPVGSATTPWTVAAGAGLEFESVEPADRMAAEESSKTAKAENRNMQNLQQKRCKLWANNVRLSGDHVFNVRRATCVQGAGRHKLFRARILDRDRTLRCAGEHGIRAVY